ncbi:MAG: aspartyl/asparaginyl beta-hydroxylase domain-containing protein, partial [Woeseiaceae bacterium]
MRLPRQFIKLPLSFDQQRLTEEIAQFGEDEWRAHISGFKGNSSLVLVSTNGEENDDFSGPMRPSPRLQRAPYIRQIMGRFNSVIGRSRLMRLAPGASVTKHTDAHYFWRDHLRIHIPIITTPDVAFYCDTEEVHMAAGESWTFNNWLEHSVENRSEHARIHLVIDTVGSSELWRMIDGRDSAMEHVA